MDAISADGADVLLRVKVVPGASRTRVLGPHGDRLRIAVAAPPERGKANAALESYLADQCSLRARDVVVEAGSTSPAKTVRLSGITVAAVQRALIPPAGKP
jgi:uncharacterized protein (TIGR00251 family)